jgi:hypothetical protein
MKLCIAASRLGRWHLEHANVDDDTSPVTLAGGAHQRHKLRACIT